MNMKNRWFVKIIQTKRFIETYFDRVIANNLQKEYFASLFSSAFAYLLWICKNNLFDGYGTWLISCQSMCQVEAKNNSTFMQNVS